MALTKYQPYRQRYMNFGCIGLQYVVAFVHDKLEDRKRFE